MLIMLYFILLIVNYLYYYIDKINNNLFGILK